MDEREHPTQYAIAVVLIVLWLLGLVTSTTMGGLIHTLLIIAIIAELDQLFRKHLQPHTVGFYLIARGPLIA